mgnify:CR=1 FL=1
MSGGPNSGRWPEEQRHVMRYIRTHVLGTNSVLFMDAIARYPNIPFFTKWGLLDILLKQNRPLEVGYDRYAHMHRGLNQFFRRRYAGVKLDTILNEAGYEPKKYGLTSGLKGRTRRGRFGEHIEYGDEYYGPIGRIGDIEFLPILRAFATFGVSHTLEGIDEVGEIQLWELTEDERHSALTLMSADMMVLCSQCETAWFDEYLVKKKTFRPDPSKEGKSVDSGANLKRIRRVRVNPLCSDCGRENKQNSEKRKQERKLRISRNAVKTGADIDAERVARARRLRAKPNPRAAIIFKNEEE